MELILIPELYPTEIEEEHMLPVFQNLFQQGLSFEAFLEIFEANTLQTLEEKTQQLLAAPEFTSLLSGILLQIKKSLLETTSWLLKNRVSYEMTQPLSPLAEEKLENLLQRFDALKNRLDAHNLSAKAARMEQFRSVAPSHLEGILRELKGELAPFLTSSEHSPEIKTNITSFLQKTETALRRALHFLLENLDSIEATIFASARGVYIPSSNHCPYPVLYMLSGNVYFVMEVLGQHIGSGVGKMVTRTFNLLTQEGFALIHSKTPSKEEDPGKEKPDPRLHFFQTWFESEFLRTLEGQTGILQMKERFPFINKENLQIFLIEVYYSGGTLQDYLDRALKKGQKSPLALRVELADQLLQGLKGMHEKNILHHDIKADNILLRFSPGPEAVITDFHYACWDSDDYKKLSSDLNVYWGAPEYMTLVSQPNTEEAVLLTVKEFPIDVWAMGLILYCLLNETLLPWIDKDKEEMPAVLAGLRTGWVPQHEETKQFYPVLEKMLDIDPEKERQQTRLCSYLGAHPI